MNSNSLKKLATCHPDLQRLIKKVDDEYPIQVVYGERDQTHQDAAFENGFSKVKYPFSMHNVNKEEGREQSHAVDIVPDPDKNPATLDWRDTKAFLQMLNVVEKVADELGIKIRLGRDFKKLKDLPHVELRK